jgi:hypothetical protein
MNPNEDLLDLAKLVDLRAIGRVPGWPRDTRCSPMPTF